MPTVLTLSNELANVVIVGGSVAGARTAQALRAEGYGGSITIVEPEAGEAYDKPPLSKEYLKGNWSRERLNLIPGGWDSVGATVIVASAVSLDTKARVLTLSNGQLLSYGALVIGTGLRPRDLVGADGVRVGHVIASMADADRVRDGLRKGAHVVVVGGGFIAAEAASVARELDLSVTVLSRGEFLLGSSLGATVGRHISETHLAQQVAFRPNVTVESILANGDQTAVTFSSAEGTSETLHADVLISGLGSIPNTEWLEGSGLRIDDGVVTDARCRAFGAKDVYALGDVANFYDVHSAKPRRVGHWTHAADQASIVAHNLLHPDDPVGYREAPYFWSDQFGQKIQVVGIPDPDAHVDLLEIEGATPRLIAIYSEGDDNECSAVVTFGWPRGMVAARKLMYLDPTSAEMLDELEKLAVGTRPAPVPA